MLVKRSGIHDSLHARGTSRCQAGNALHRLHVLGCCCCRRCPTTAKERFSWGHSAFTTLFRLVFSISA
jgi:hypothetical protein